MLASTTVQSSEGGAAGGVRELSGVATSEGKLELYTELM